MNGARNGPPDGPRPGKKARKKVIAPKDGKEYVYVEPELVHFVQPDYPESALKNGIEGTVHVLVLIGAKGEVIKTKVKKMEAGSEDLESERQALEELLDEALSDLQTKDDEIGRLETSLRRASKDAAAASSARTRDADHLARRLRTLYKNL